MSELDHSVESLIASESFQAYCLKTSQQEIEKWEKWILEHPERKSNVEEARNWILSLHAMADPSEAAAEWNKLLAKLPSETLTPLQKGNRFWPRLARVGIAACLAFLIGFGFWYMSNSTPVYMELTTGYGEVKEIKLPDGSHLTLNGHSKVKFEEQWSREENREIWLEGEGYFEVERDEDHPFIVHMKYGDVKVLGTEFNALHRDRVQRVTLIEGLVKLIAPAHEALELLPGEQVTMNAKAWEKERVDIEPITAWKNNKMIFKDASIRSIIDKLRWDFNWDIQVMETSILDRRVSTIIQENNPELLLQALAEIYDLNFEKKGEGQYLIR